MEKKIIGKSLLLLESLLEYYKNNISILNSIITQKNSLSLRILDWLVTNYAKKHNIIYRLETNTENDIFFNIYLDYKNQLKAYSKKLFDPFCRRERIVINITTLEWFELTDKNYENNSNEIITTVGQLNFFKWFIENKILNFAIENIKEIDDDMNKSLDNYKSSNKRRELSKCAIKSVCSYTQYTNIVFN